MCMMSILLTSYNNSKFIGETIRSIQEQSSPDWELIIVDDLSTDDSIDIIETFQTDGRIKLILNI